MTGQQTHGCTVRCIGFDFVDKRDEEFPIEKLNEVGSRFVWIDVDVTDVVAAKPWLVGLGLVDSELIDDAMDNEPTTHLARFEKYLHLVVAACRFKTGIFDLERIDLFMGQNFMLTLHKGQVGFIEKIRTSYRDDFIQFAQSPSFLLYEVWDHLIDHYTAVQKQLEDEVVILQRHLMLTIDDDIFARVSLIGSQLLHFRKVLLPSRGVLTELASRKTTFISEATQPFLANMVGIIDRVQQDALVDRDILTQSVSLHMSMVAHKTSTLMNKLTVVSVIFLPLTFLCGVYGMNFDVLPELHWTYGYAAFWVVALVIVGSLSMLLRRLRLL